MGPALDAAAALTPAQLYDQAVQAAAVAQTIGVGLASVAGWVVLLLLIAASPPARKPAPPC